MKKLFLTYNENTDTIKLSAISICGKQFDLGEIIEPRSQNFILHLIIPLGQFAVSNIIAAVKEWNFCYFPTSMEWNCCKVKVEL